MRGDFVLGESAEVLSAVHISFEYSRSVPESLFPKLCTAQVVSVYSGVLRGRDVYMLQFSWHKPRWVGEALQFLFIFTNAMLTCKAKRYLTETLHALSTLG